MNDAVRLLGESLRDVTTGQVTLTPQTVVSAFPLIVRGEYGEPVAVRRTTDWTPNVGDQILCLRVGTSVWAVGPVTPAVRPPSIGTVVSVAGRMVTVRLGGPFGNVAMPSTVTVSSGQRVGISWMQNDAGRWVGFIAGAIQTDPSPAPPPPPPPPADSGGGSGAPPPSPTKRTIRRRVIEARTWRGGWRAGVTDAYQGVAGRWGSSTPNRGYLFYARGAFDDLRGKTVTSATIRLTAKRGVGAAGPTTVRIRIHTSPARTKAQPRVLADEALVALADGQTKTVPLPVAMAQKLVDGAAAGIAFSSNSAAEYNAIVGPATNASSGMITITAT